MTDELRDRFVSLFSKKMIAKSDQCYLELERHYSEPHRHYHTIRHIDSCLKHMDTIQFNNSNRAIELAIWFHDAIYNPLRKNNEEKSAELAAYWLKELAEPDEVIEAVKHFIILTKHPSEPNTIDEKYLLDIDLSILGAEPTTYLKYESWVRDEYNHIPNFIYSRGRKKLLRSFLQQKRIYKTEKFHNLFEHQAKSNIQLAIIKLGG